MTAEPANAPSPGVADLQEPERSWRAVVWNDPVTLMTYVEYVFRSYFGYSQVMANTLMLRVHEQGRAVVSTGPREQIEMDVRAMHEYGLQATVERGEQ